jgi:squalene-hopene/tetraprenyl-beta-curcumene cyclase
MGILLVGILGVGLGQPATAQPPAADAPPVVLSDVRADSPATREAIDKGVKYLLAAQRGDGGWEADGRTHPAITAIVVTALARQPGIGPEHPAVRRGIELVLRSRQPDGGIYVPGEGMLNYHTSIALMALAAEQNPAHREAIVEAQGFLRKIQWDEGEEHQPSSPWYGGQGYGNGKRPDLSNTQLMIEALHDSGLSPDDPAYRKAMAFVSRCQMLDETNDQAFANGSRDGGFIYSPANDGESKAGTDSVDGRPMLRSYGSMTYSGFKSMLYANVDRKDPRVTAAMDWIRRHYRLDSNPNMPEAQAKQGLYYYYHVFARAMEAWGEDVIVDAKGAPHRWRDELCAALVAQQNPDGSWVNSTDRWFEGNPHLVTAYALRALQTATNPSAQDSR